MKLIFLATMLVLCACQTEQSRRDDLSRTMSSWEGHNIDELIIKMGPPSGTYQMNSGTMFVWRAYGGVVGYGYGSMVAARQLYCDKRFLTNDSHIIQSWSFEGNCY